MVSTLLPERFLVALFMLLASCSVHGFSVQPKTAVRQDSRLFAGTPMVPYKVRLSWVYAAIFCCMHIS